jgi:hypothetical protein
MTQRFSGRRSCIAIAPFITAVLICGWIAQVTAAPAGTEETARRYLKAIAKRDLDGQPFADRALMQDPTADFFDLDTLVSGVRGRDEIIALQKSWNLRKIKFELDTEFFVGEYAAFSGTAEITGAKKDDRHEMYFLTVLRIEDDTVTERHDFWDYAGGYGTHEKQQTNGDATRSVADAYLAAYLEKNYDDAHALMATNITFQDPTARVFDPNAGALIEGADELTDRRRETFGGILEFGLEVERSFVTNHHAVYLGRTYYSIPGAAFRSEVESVRFEHRAAFVIGVENGEVVYHRDFVDYSNFRQQVREQIGE